MRLLRCFVAAMFALGLSALAKADDFQMVVIDPSVPATPVYSDDFSFTLTPCTASQLDGLSPSTYLGCFSGENETGQPLTSLQLLIPIFDYDNQLDQPGCAPVAQDIFSTITCGFTSNNLDYYVDFSGGSIPSATPGSCSGNPSDSDYAEEVEECNSASIFTIAVADVPPADFPQDIPVVANAPEPGSIYLMVTGVALIGLGCVVRRRSRAATPGNEL